MQEIGETQEPGTYTYFCYLKATFNVQMIIG